MKSHGIAIKVGAKRTAQKWRQTDYWWFTALFTTRPLFDPARIQAVFVQRRVTVEQAGAGFEVFRKTGCVMAGQIDFAWVEIWSWYDNCATGTVEASAQQAFANQALFAKQQG